MMSLQTSQNRGKFSSLRKRLRQLAQEVVRLIEPFMSDKPVVRGSLYELKRKCGRKNCACAEGAPHISTALSLTVDGRKRIRLVPKGDVRETKSKTERYRALRRSRARVVKLHGEMISLMDEMEAMRREEEEKWQT